MKHSHLYHKISSSIVIKLWLTIMSLIGIVLAIVYFIFLGLFNKFKIETTATISSYVIISFMLMLVVVSLVTTVFAWYLSKRITAPLLQLQQAVQSVGEGNFSMRLPVVGEDEVAQLSDDFNRMQELLQQQVKTIEQSNQKFVTIVGNLPIGIMLIRETIPTYVNKRAKNLMALLNDADQHTLSDYIKQSMTMSTTIEPIVLKSKDYNYVILAQQISKIATGENLALVMQDLSEEQKSIILRNDFLSNVSHELRSPIGMIQGYSEAILDGFSNEAETQEFVHIINDEAHRMTRLINELLDLSKVESGTFRLHREEQDIINFVHKVTYKFKQTAINENIDLSIRSYVGEQYTVVFDSDRIEQVLHNLLDNAMRYTNNKVTVTIKLSSNKDHIEVAVADNGKGIPQEDLPYVFNRFYKVDKARTREKNGTGLGLAIAQSFVQAHKGYIKVTSDIGEGTRFTFALPVYHE